jgi:hypothetical protein
MDQAWKAVHQNDQNYGGRECKIRQASDGDSRNLSAREQKVLELLDIPKGLKRMERNEQERLDRIWHYYVYSCSVVSGTIYFWTRSS